MTRTQKIAYGLFAQTVILLLLYAAASLLAAVKFLTPNDPLALSLPYQQVGGLANVLLHLAALTGLLGGGVYLAVAERADKSVTSKQALNIYFLLWTLLLVLSVAAGILDMLDGRYMLELPPLLTLARSALAGLIATEVLRSASGSSPVWVWTVGIGLGVLGGLAGVLPSPDFVSDQVMRLLSIGLTINMGYPVAALALGFWLMRRFSHVPAEWAEIGVYTVGGLATTAGLLVTLASLYRLTGDGFSLFLGNVAVIVVPVIYLIIAAHSYAALSDRNTNPALSAHWFALSILLYLAGIGVLGGLQAASGVNQWTIGTRLTDLQTTLALFGTVAMTLGVANMGAAELFGQNRRVTGLAPFWLVAFGVVGGGLALALAGVAQTYMERFLSVGYLDVQNLLIPLYALWVLGGLLLALGVGAYALGFWARRPVEA
jgi:hypothetical protein